MKVFTIPNQSEKDKLETKLAEYSDYAICLGGLASNQEGSKKIGYFAAKNNNSFIYRTDEHLEKLIGCRPAIEPISIKNIAPEILFFKNDTELIIGEYPQRAVDLELSQKLDELLKQKKLVDTGKKYTTKVNHDGTKYTIDCTSEYYYNGKKYVQVRLQSLLLEQSLSNGQKLKDDSLIWCEVEPIEYTVFNDMWVSRKCLFSGIPYSFKLMDSKETVENSFLNTYLNTTFLTDMTPRGYELFLKSQRKELNHTELLIMISYYQHSDYIHFKMVREVLKNYSQEYLTYFESCWVQSDFDRARELEVLRRKENLPNY